MQMYAGQNTCYSRYHGGLYASYRFDRRLHSRNKCLSESIYKSFNTRSPLNNDGSNQYWDLVFEGLRKKKDSKGH